MYLQGSPSMRGSILSEQLGNGWRGMEMREELLIVIIVIIHIGIVVLQCIINI